MLMLFLKADIGREAAGRITVIEVTTEAACKSALAQARRSGAISDGFCCRPASEDVRPRARGGDKPCFRS